MKYYRFMATTPYCGTDCEEYRGYPDNITEEELEQEADTFCYANAESFEYMVTGWNDDEFENETEREEAIENYYNDCYCTYEEISEEEYLANI